MTKPNAKKAERIAKEAVSKRERDWKDLASVLACYLRTDAMLEYLNQILEKYSPEVPLAEHRFRGASDMFYASLCPLIEAWETRLCPVALRRDDSLEALLASHFRDDVFEFRNAVWHFTPYNDSRVLEVLRNNVDVQKWARNFHYTFGQHLDSWREELAEASEDK